MIQNSDKAVLELKLYSQSYGAGQPLIILHGLLGASGNWHTLSRNVFGKHFQVFTLDLRNHGRSPHDDRFDFPSMVEDVRAFMRDENLSSAHVLGHSMGGKVAMLLALNYPELVDHLIVADIAPRAYPPHHMHILNALRDLDLPAYTSRTQIDEALSVNIKELGVRQFLMKNLSSNGAGGYVWKMNLPAIYDNYTKINVEVSTTNVFTGPVLFIKGGRSNYITDKDVPAIETLFPAAAVQTIPGIGHWVHAEAPKAFSEMVLNFLSD